MSESVQSNSAVLVHFTLKLEDGTTAESTRNNGKPALFRLGDASLSEGLEQHLLGLKVGDKTTFSLEPDAAFGVKCTRTALLLCTDSDMQVCSYILRI
ncbi:FKBP-type peptidyl-prolyl cis-trans isomerase, partial [Escherichia coli]